MKRVNMNVVLTGWLAVVLMAGSPAAFAESGQHNTGQNTGQGAPQGQARPAVVNVPLPPEYEQLLTALGKVDTRGLKVTESWVLDGTKKDLEVSIDQVVKMVNWVKTAKEYREFLTACAVQRDKGADAFGKILDAFIAKLQSAITDDPKNASGLREKELVTYVAQMERFLKERASLFSSSKADFEKADEKFLDHMKKTVGALFGGFHGDQFDSTKQLADDVTKPIVEQMDAAIAAMTAHEAAGGKSCKMTKEEEAATEGEQKPEESNTSTSTNTGEEGRRARLDNPGPIEGNTPEEGQPESQPEQPADPGAGADTSLPDVGGDVPFFDPGLQAQDDFDADALLRGVLDRLDDQQRQQELEQQRQAQDVQNAIDAARRLGDDILRQQQAAVDAQNNDDAGLAEALKGLAAQQPPPPPVTPPAAPPTIPPVIPPSDSGDQGQPFLPPPQDDFGGQQAAAPQMPFMPPQPQSSPPIIIGGQDTNKYDDDDFYRRRAAVPPQVNPQAAGMLEMLRLQQQLMFAQQQALQQGTVGVGLNVNTMANRLGGASPSTRRVIPGRTQANGGSPAVQSGAARTGRSTTVPSAIRGSLVR